MTQDESALVRGLDAVIGWVASHKPENIRAYVDNLRAQNPGISNDDLARKIVKRKAFKSGLVGATTGVGGLIVLPATIPIDLGLTWRIQAAVALSTAYAYGNTADTLDLKTDLYLILAGDSAKEALKRAGIEVAKEVTKRAVSRYVTRDVMKRVCAVIGRKIVTKAGEKSLTSLVKLVPLVGAPIGFAADWAATRTVGHYAIKYYSGQA
jgi:hypothetical protein